VATPLTAILITGPAPASGIIVLNSDGSFTFTPAAGFTGPASFTYRANNNTLSNIATVNLTVTVPPAPTATDDAFSTVAGIALTVAAPGVLGNDTNPVATPLTAILVAGPAAGTGTVVLNGNGSFTYTPAAGFIGAATFTYTASNGTVSNVATVTINVTAPPAPTAVDNTFTTAVNTTLTVAAPGILGNDTTPVALPLTAIALVAVPTTPAGSGTVTLNTNGSFTYIPATGFIGAAAFTYQATNGTVSNVATVTINVTAVAAPIAANDAFTTAAGTTLTVAAPGVLGNDTPAPLTAVLVADPAPASGTLVLNANGSFTFIPAAGFTGAASFTYQASNGTLSNVATVTITVTAASVGPTITGFVLRNANTDTLFGSGVLTNGTIVSRGACGGCTFNMEALVSGTGFNNVRLVLTRPDATTHANNEGAFPFTKPGDGGVGNYNGLALPLDGTYTLFATPRLANGTPTGTPLTVTFTVTP
jgi:hypothetical protein